MEQRKPLSRKVRVWFVLGLVVVGLLTGILMGLLAPELSWLHYVIVGVLAAAAVLVFKVIGGFDELEARRRSRGTGA